MWGDVGIAPYEERGAMPEKILRFAQNDRKYAKFPQAFPLEVIPPCAGEMSAQPTKGARLREKKVARP